MASTLRVSPTPGRAGAYHSLTCSFFHSAKRITQPRLGVRYWWQWCRYCSANLAERLRWPRWPNMVLGPSESVLPPSAPSPSACSKPPRELSDYMGGRLWGLGGGLQEKSSKGTSFKRISLWSQWSLWFKVVIEINQRMPTKVFGNPECLKV